MARPILEIIAEMQASAGQPATNLPLSEVKRWADELAEWVTELKSAAMEAADDEFASDPKPDPDDPTADSE